MRAGKHLSSLPEEEMNLLAPVNIRGKKRDSALLLLHGYSSSPAVFRRMIPKIRGYDAIIAPALAGHAVSILEFSNIKNTDWLKSAEETAEKLVNEYQEVDVVGLSLGGLLACHLSQLYRFRHLYLLAPALALQYSISAQIRLASFLQWLGFRRIRNAAGNLYTNEFAELGFKQLPLSSTIEILTLIQNFQLVVPLCPTDVFLGAFDAVVNSAKVASMFADKSNIHIHWLKHSAHVLPLDGDVDVILNCIQNNIAQ